MPTKTQRVDYAVYRGDDFIDIGTADELAKEFGVTAKTVKWWAKPSNIRRDKGNRIVAVKLTDEDW